MFWFRHGKLFWKSVPRLNVSWSKQSINCGTDYCSSARNPKYKLIFFWCWLNETEKANQDYLDWNTEKKVWTHIRGHHTNKHWSRDACQCKRKNSLQLNEKRIVCYKVYRNVIENLFSSRIKKGFCHLSQHPEKARKIKRWNKNKLEKKLK